MTEHQVVGRITRQKIMFVENEFNEIKGFFMMRPIWWRTDEFNHFTNIESEEKFRFWVFLGFLKVNFLEGSGACWVIVALLHLKLLLSFSKVLFFLFFSLPGFGFN